MIAVDFFCGAGGLSRGLRNAGIEVVLGIDLDATCRETYETNNPPARFLAADIRQLACGELAADLQRVPPSDLLLAACAPCQPFSPLNREGRGDTATLLSEFVRFVIKLRPYQVVIENVPGLARVRGFSTYQRFKTTLHRLGYKLSEGVLDAKHFGVPQTRRRLVLIAMLGITPTLPPPTHGRGLLPYQTVADAILDYPPIKAGEVHSTVPNHRAAFVSDLNLRRLRATPLNGGSRTSWPEDLWLTCHKQHVEGHTDVYGRMRWDQPAPTLTCRCNSISNGRYGHPEQDRAISLREAAKLQTFEDNYIFYGVSLRALAAQIGNAVPVRLAEAIGRQILLLARREWTEIPRG